MMTLKIGTKVQINAANTIYHEDKGVIVDKIKPNNFEVAMKDMNIHLIWGAWMLQEDKS